MVAQSSRLRSGSVIAASDANGLGVGIRWRTDACGQLFCSWNSAAVVPLAGHPIGNLMLAGLSKGAGRSGRGRQTFERILGVKGEVLSPMYLIAFPRPMSRSGVADPRTA